MANDLLQQSPQVLDSLAGPGSCGVGAPATPEPAPLPGLLDIAPAGQACAIGGG